MLTHKPLLSDLPASRHVFQPGERVLVRVSVNLTHDQYCRVERAVKKYAQQSDIRVLIVDCTFFKLVWYQGTLRSIRTLASKLDIQEKGIDCGVANLDCSVTELAAGDRLVVSALRITSERHRQEMKDWVQRWAGKDVEVIVQEGPI